MKNIVKRFPGVTANNHANLTIHAGEIHALLGENGAGKSTLVKCIMGTYRADPGGQVKVGEHHAELKNPRQAHALGIGMVYQHFTLVENMSVVENMLMAREQVPAFINWKRECEQLEAFMAKMPFRVDPKAIVRNLSAGEVLEQLSWLFRSGRLHACPMERKPVPAGGCTSSVVTRVLRIITSSFASTLQNSGPCTFCIWTTVKATAR